ANPRTPRTSRTREPREPRNLEPGTEPGKPQPATRNPEPSLLIRPDQPRLLDHVLLDRGEALLPVRARLQLDLRVERVEPEVIMMRPVPRRRHRPEVPGLPRAVHAFRER